MARLSLYGPVEGWLVKTENIIGFVKGCFHPLPRLIYTPRVVKGARLWEVSPPEFSRNTRCFDVPVPAVLPGRGVRLVSPLEAAEKLRRGLLCASSRVCRAARLLVEELASATGDGVGVTGGLSYRPEAAGDVDVVVYGWRNILRVYRRLWELRREGITRPYLGLGHGWSSADATLHRRLASGRLLFGLVDGVEYNVRLVSCTRPAPCARVVSRGTVTARGRICGGTGFTTPLVYRLCGGSDPAALLVISHRLRYVEIPLGSVVEVKGVLQEVCGLRLISPDHGGWIRVIELGRGDWLEAQEEYIARRAFCAGGEDGCG